MDPFILPVREESVSGDKLKTASKTSSKRSLGSAKEPNKVSSRSSLKSARSTSKKTHSNVSIKKTESQVQHKIQKEKEISKEKKERDEGTFWTTFGPEDVYSTKLFDRSTNDWVDGNYLTSLMPNQARDTKLEILELLDDMCCSVMESRAEQGKNECEFPLPKNLLGYSDFDQKEMAELLYTRISSRGGILGYAKPLENKTFSLVLTWFSKDKIQQNTSTSSKTSNKKGF